MLYVNKKYYLCKMKLRLTSIRTNNWRNTIATTTRRNNIDDTTYKPLS